MILITLENYWPELNYLLGSDGVSLCPSFLFRFYYCQYYQSSSVYNNFLIVILSLFQSLRMIKPEKTIFAFGEDFLTFCTIFFTWSLNFSDHWFQQVQSNSLVSISKHHLDSIISFRRCHLVDYLPWPYDLLIIPFHVFQLIMSLLLLYICGVFFHHLLDGD